MRFLEQLVRSLKSCPKYKRGQILLLNLRTSSQHRQILWCEPHINSARSSFFFSHEYPPEEDEDYGLDGAMRV
jgi:hypothetical protein